MNLDEPLREHAIVTEMAELRRMRNMDELWMLRGENQRLIRWVDVGNKRKEQHVQTDTDTA